jgi:NAD(P)-dependent dehydrogenase (short-subunit alcohol dehydrogenase family)
VSESAVVQPVACVVGVGPGLGLALARRFSREGYAVLGLARDPSKLTPEPGLTLRAADAADAGALATALGQDGPVEVLLYNAYRATMATTGPSSLDPDALIEDFRVNVAGALAAVRAVLPGMLAAGRGTILLTGGGLALDPTGWLPAASLAVGKAGLRSLALTLHAELAPRGVHVGTVTVAGQIKPDTAFDPDRIADTFWSLHADPPGGFRAEVAFGG